MIRIKNYDSVAKIIVLATEPGFSQVMENHIYDNCYVMEEWAAKIIKIMAHEAFPS